jgi:hypothetical protein
MAACKLETFDVFLEKKGKVGPRRFLRMQHFLIPMYAMVLVYPPSLQSNFNRPKFMHLLLLDVDNNKYLFVYYFFTDMFPPGRAL